MDEPALEIDCIIISRKLRTLPQDIILVLLAFFRPEILFVEALVIDDNLVITRVMR